MAQLTIQINGRPYSVGCEDGQEAHLQDLARLFDGQVRQVSQDVGQLGETRLFLMAALLLADELSDLRARTSGLQAEAAKAHQERSETDLRAVAALEKAAQRIEAMATSGSVH
jgi:cell division protein ZapA